MDGAFVAIAELTGGKWLGNWMGLAGAVSATGLLCTLLCTSSRQLAGMASTGAVNKIFATKHPKATRNASIDKHTALPHEAPQLRVVLSCRHLSTCIKKTAAPQVSRVFFSFSGYKSASCKRINE